MAERIIGYFARRIGDPYLLSAILSVIPATELKGSILYAATCGGKVWLAALVGYLTSLLFALIHTLILPVVVCSLRRHPRWERVWLTATDRISSTADRILRRANGSEDRTERLFLGVYAFVAIPLPLTGIWAGAILATLVGLDRGHTFFALAAGNFTAGGIVLAIAFLAGTHASLVLDVFCFLVLLFIIGTVMRHFVKRRRLAK